MTENRGLSKRFVKHLILGFPATLRVLPRIAPWTYPLVTFGS
jgi:hypothetical protein